ncbi:OmpA family protein [Lewinella sp. JB7]|uniref:OmpA/MotB family protein n=1 Tax=Lewinella sp. JB7 TaxID=2962887 RepID=UPI0020C973C3|nr:OmpA family protein [Lewinella sp. JB7]MCP9234590.1 OmpA family protein [Lewinella sp. JB7]
MRPLLYGLLALFLSSCISPKKAAERYEPRIDSLATLVEVRNDTIQRLSLALERSRGGNDMLLETQNRLQDRLLAQDDEIERLQRSLSSTSSDMSGQIEDLRQRLLGRQRTLDSLINAQALAVGQYADGLRRAANRLSDSLETKLPPTDFEVSEAPGEVILSIQEMVLFRPRSVGYLANGNEVVLKLVTETLQQNPLLKLRIVGHTDNQPNPLRGTDNWKYGALRATKLADELATTYYVSPNRIVAASQGEYGPSRSNATEEGRTRNRRIDFVFTSNVGNLLRELEKLTQIGEQ